MQAKLIFLIDADDRSRQELQAFFHTRGIKAEGHATAESALLALHCRQPDCVILEHSLPDMEGADLQQRLAAQGIPHLFLAAQAEAAAIVLAMRLGASDFLLKPADPWQIYERTVSLLLDRTTARTAGTLENLKEVLISRLNALTRRERNILQLALTGKSNKEISLVLGISHRTVETHRAHILEKICVDNLLQFAYIFSDLGDYLNGKIPADTTQEEMLPLKLQLEQSRQALIAA